MKRLTFIFPTKRAHRSFKVIRLHHLKSLMGAKETWFVERDLIHCWAPTSTVKRNPTGVREALEKRHYNLPREFTEKLAEGVD